MIHIFRTKNRMHQSHSRKWVLLQTYLLIFFAGLVSLVFQTGCKKLVEVDAPGTSINSINIYTNDATAIAAVTGIFAQMSNTLVSTQVASPPGASYFLGLSADELTLFSGVSNLVVVKYYRNNLDAVSADAINFWSNLYPIIYQCNAAIEGLTNSNTLTASVKQQLLGEAKFCRAFCYFYLVNLYGDIALQLTTDWQVNSALPRSPQDQVWEQVKKDLIDAQNLLSENYLDASLLNTRMERIRPTKWAASALLARSYLYTQNWDSAEVVSSSIINNVATYSLDTLNGVFLKNSSEAIWQWPRTWFGGKNTPDAQVFILPDAGPTENFPLYLGDHLLNAFEADDNRRANWVDSIIPEGSATTYYYPFKYKIADPDVDPIEYVTVLRFAEQYLVRAEARLQKGENNAVDDLNVIRNRAGLNNYTGPMDKSSLLNAILHERQVEFFTEWGHRWLDLKRTNTIDEVMSIVTPQKGGGAWQTSYQWYPIPSSELQKMPQMAQNPGY